MLLEETQSGLIDACRRGESEALRELFDLYKDKLYSVALRYSGDSGAAEDIVQDTFLKLTAALEKFRGDASFDAWIYRLVVNACFDYRRRIKRLLPAVESLLDLVRSSGRTPLDQALTTERNDLLRKAIGKLDHEYRIVVVLRYSAGLSYEEIGGVLDLPVGTVASRLHRAHGMLEKKLRKPLGRERNV